MPVTAKRAKELALSLENASSYPHFDRVAFRTPRRTFATLALNGEDLNFMLDAAEQRHFCGLAPHAIEPVAGGWGRMGWTRCELRSIDAATFNAALLAARARTHRDRNDRARRRDADTRAALRTRRESASLSPSSSCYIGSHVCFGSISGQLWGVRFRGRRARREWTRRRAGDPNGRGGHASAATGASGRGRSRQ